MDDVLQRIHVNEFAAHMALFGVAPVWQHLFGRQIDARNLVAIQDRMRSATEPLTVAQVDQGVRQNLGDDAARWMWTCFISTAEPRAAAQQAVLTAFVRPTVAPAHDPAACQNVAKALTPDRIAALEGLEQLLGQLALQPPDPRDAGFIAGLAGFVLADAPAQRLTDSIYLSILSAALPGAGKGR
jgi:hypothetical protein